LIIFAHMDISVVNAVMDLLHSSVNQVYEHMVDGDKEELNIEIDSLIAALQAIKEEAIT
jgi:hypothetical protein